MCKIIILYFLSLPVKHRTLFHNLEYLMQNPSCFDSIKLIVLHCSATSTSAWFLARDDECNPAGSFLTMVHCTVHFRTSSVYARAAEQWI